MDVLCVNLQATSDRYKLSTFTSDHVQSSVDGCWVLRPVAPAQRQTYCVRIEFTIAHAPIPRSAAVFNPLTAQCP